MGDTTKMSQAERDAAALKTQVAKENREKRHEKANVLKYLIIAMAVIYFADIMMLDTLLFGITSFFATIIGGMLDTTTWVATVKASLGSIKLVTFLGAAGVALFLVRQKA